MATSRLRCPEIGPSQPYRIMARLQESILMVTITPTVLGIIKHGLRHNFWPGRELTVCLQRHVAESACKGRIWYVDAPYFALKASIDCTPDAAGYAFAISYQSDLSKVTLENLVVFTTKYQYAIFPSFLISPLTMIDCVVLPGAG